MLHILIVVAWIVAFGCWVYLASQVLKHRLFDRGQKKVTARRFLGFGKPHHSNEKHQGSMRSPDGAVPLKTDEGTVGVVRRRGLALFGYFMLFLWEAYWVSEIVERFSRSSNPLQLPYFFLLFVMVGVPLAVYLFSRRILRTSVHSS